MRRGGPPAFALAAALAVGAAPATAEEGVAVLQALDKVLGKTSTFEAPVGMEVRFGALEIVVRACRDTPPEQPPDSFAFLEIDDAHPGQGRKRVFTGWMLASSPAVSALEHPVYDVWVTGCKKG